MAKELVVSYRQPIWDFEETEPVGTSEVLPVTVKSLMFRAHEALREMLAHLEAA